MKKKQPQHCAHVAAFYKHLSDVCVGMNSGLYLYLTMARWIQYLRLSGGKL